MSGWTMTTFGGPDAVGVGSVLRRRSDGVEAVVVGFQPPTCTTFVTVGAFDAGPAADVEPVTVGIDSCDYIDKPGKPWEVVYAAPPRQQPEGGV